jgi:hypothetical protein
MTPSAQTAGGRRVRRWTREEIVAKILEWEARYGEPPCSADWNPSLARHRHQEWRAERYRAGRWPSTNAVKRAYGGSFDAALRAAGREPHRPGPRRRGPGEPRPAVAVEPDRIQLTPAELAALRAGGPSGPAVLASALKRLARARAAGDRRGLEQALGEVASAAVRWRDRM